MPNVITVLPKGPAPTLADLAQYRPCIVCDLYIKGIEHAPEQLTWGFRDGTLVNIDHHAPQARFETDVTSTELAIQRVLSEGIAAPGTNVIINHTDCDSILSSAIIAGLLPPLDRFREAALAADHTGDPDEIADMLQGMDDQALNLSGAERLRIALEAIAALEAGVALPTVAQAVVAKRTESRAEARIAVDAGRFTSVGDIRWAEFSEKQDGELFLPLLPEAAIVVVGHPHETVAGMTGIKARLGRAKRAGMSLQRMGIEAFDPNWGGRWDAGSNNRGSGNGPPGTAMGVGEWVGSLTAGAPGAGSDT